METAMKNGKMPTGDEIIQNGYNDWIALLKHTDNEDVLKDSYNPWAAGFRDGVMVERYGCLHAIETQVSLATPQEFDDVTTMSIDDVKQVQINLLKQVLKIISSKGI